MEKVHVSFIFLSAAVLSESALCEEKSLKDDYTDYNSHGPWCYRKYNVNHTSHGE